MRWIRILWGSQIALYYFFFKGKSSRFPFYPVLFSTSMWSGWHYCFSIPEEAFRPLGSGTLLHKIRVRLSIGVTYSQWKATVTKCFKAVTLKDHLLQSKLWLSRTSSSAELCTQKLTVRFKELVQGPSLKSFYDIVFNWLMAVETSGLLQCLSGYRSFLFAGQSVVSSWFYCCCLAPVYSFSLIGFYHCSNMTRFLGVWRCSESCNWSLQIIIVFPWKSQLDPSVLPSVSLSSSALPLQPGFLVSFS